MTQRAITVLLTAVTGPYVANMGRAAGATASVGTAAQGAQAKTGMLGGAMSGLSGKLLAGGGLVFAVSKTAGMLMDYEDALVGVGKTTGLTGAELSALGDDLTDLAKNIRGSSEDMLGIAQSAAQLGIANEDIVAFTETIANLASATDLTVDTAATGMARLANILQMPADEFENLASSIVRMGNTMATTEPEVLGMAQRVASAGRAAGLTEAEIIGLAAAASSLGLEAEAGGSALSMTLVRIQEAAITGGQELETFASTAGMSGQQFAATWREEPVAALMAFLDGLGQVQESGGDTVAILDALGLDGLRVSDTLRRLSGNTGLVEDATRGATDAFVEGQDAIEEATVANATASAAWDNLKDSLADFGRTAAGGEEGTSLLTGSLNALSAAVENLNEVLFRVDQFEDLNHQATEATTTFGKLEQGLDDFLQPFSALLVGDLELFDQSWMVNIDEASTVTGYLSGDMARLEAATSRVPPVFDDAADSTAELGRQFGLTAEELDELSAEMLAATDPAYAYVRAQDAAQEAADAYADAVDEHGAASDEAATALLELLEAEQKVDATAVSAGQSFDDLTGHVDRLEESGRLTADQADRLRAQIAGARAEAERFAGDYIANLNVNVRGMQAASDRLTALATRRYGATVTERAHGGPVWPGGMFLVGEEGPELFAPDTAGQIIPAGDTSKMMLAPMATQSVGRTGGDINLTVHAGMGADGNRIGSEIVEHLIKFQKHNGTIPLNIG